MSSDVNTLAEPLRSAVINLIADAQANGTQVVVVSARRTNAEQIALRRQNCATVKGQPTEADVFTKPSGRCNPETAIPGTSKHENGTAVDLGGDLGFVAANASKHGLVRTVASEDWHFEHRTTAGRGDKSPDPVDQGTPSSGGILSKAGDLIGGGAAAVGDAAGEKFIPGYGVVKDVGSAAVAVAAAVLNPQTWLRAVGIVAGLGLTVVGLNMISRDIGGPAVSPTGIAKAATPTAAVAARSTPPTTAVA